MRILITGASGFIGRHLVRALAPEHALICLVRSPKNYRRAGDEEFIPADLTDPDFTRLLPKRIDAVVHLAQADAAVADDRNRFFSVNCVSTQRLAEYAREAGASCFLYTSSGSVYAPSIHPLTEESRRTAVNDYARSKIQSEDLLGDYKAHFHISVLRLFAPYGPGQSDRMIPRIVRSVQQRSPVLLINGGKPRINPVYIDDLISILARSLSLPGWNIFNVAGPRTVDVRDIALIAGDKLGIAPRFENRAEPYVSDLVGVTIRLGELLNLRPQTDPVEGIAQVVDSVAARVGGQENPDPETARMRS